MRPGMRTRWSLVSRRFLHLNTKSLGTTNRKFSHSRQYRAYDDTIQNLLIGSETRVIFQGFTGRQGTANAKESLDWGTKIVGGVKPNSEGEHLGLPVLPSVRKAMEVLKPDATGIYVAAHQATAAIEESIEAEVPLIVAVAEHIPLHDILRVGPTNLFDMESKSRLVGANAPGIISAIGHCRIGFQPLPTFSPGHVGIAAKSGTLSYETVASLTRAGVGQSLCIGIGGDVVAGTNFIDALKVFEQDKDTDAIILVGEVGGTSEEEAADWIRDYKKRVSNPKPIAALVAGIYAVPGKVMGHAGAWAAPGEGSAVDKWKALENASAVMVDHPAKFGNVMKSILSSNGRTLRSKSGHFTQNRGIHSLRRVRSRQSHQIAPNSQMQRRSLHLKHDQAIKLLKEYDIDISPNPEEPPEDTKLVAITVHRTARSPCIIVSPTVDSTSIHSQSLQIPFDYRIGPEEKHISTAINHLDLSPSPESTQSSVRALISRLWTLYHEKEAVSLSLHLYGSPAIFTNPTLMFDDAAFRSTKRHAALHALRDPSLLSALELAAEPHGIVYIPLAGAHCTVGTIVNGAGLAMNTVDALATHALRATNFLDTGGKATSDTVKTSFELVLADPRVKCVFVNIFGGLTLGDMIARGVVLAFKEVGVSVPVVVRIRGTNEAEGQRIIAESGLPLFAFDGFEEAAEKIRELVGKD